MVRASVRELCWLRSPWPLWLRVLPGETLAAVFNCIRIRLWSLVGGQAAAVRLASRAARCPGAGTGKDHALVSLTSLTPAEV